MNSPLRNKRLILPANDKSDSELKCPHCKGELLQEPAKYVQWKYLCKRCGRAWIILDEIYWLAGFDAGGHVYKVQNGKVEEIRETNPLWEKLWERVR